MRYKKTEKAIRKKAKEKKKEKNDIAQKKNCLDGVRHLDNIISFTFEEV